MSNNENTNHNDNNHDSLGVVQTRFQIRLRAQKLPKGGNFGFTYRYPTTYAMVTRVPNARQSGGGGSSGGTYIKDDFKGRRKLSSSMSGGTMQVLGTTEVISNSDHPQWLTTIPIDYEFGSKCSFYVHVFQGDKTELQKSRSSRKKNCLGTALFDVADIIGHKDAIKAKRLKCGGCIYVRLEKLLLGSNTQYFRFDFQALNLKVSGGMLSKKPPDTVLEVRRHQVSKESQHWVRVFRSSPVLESYSPRWDAAEIDLPSLCRNDLNTLVRLSVFKVKDRARDALLGQSETTVQHILDNGSENLEAHEKCFILQKNADECVEVGQLRVHQAELYNFKQEKKGQTVEEGGSLQNERESSCSSTSVENLDQLAALPPVTSEFSPPTPRPFPTLDSKGMDDPFSIDIKQLSMRAIQTTVSTSTTESGYTLHEFIDLGGQLDFCVAIDFTSSNGNPLEEGTLHFQSDDVMNDYEETIVSIGNAIAKYNENCEFVVWGFGAQFGDGVLRHLFQCGPNPTVKGIDGILDAYRSVARGGLTMSGPTVFLKAIQAAAVRARKLKSTQGGNLRYGILLVITDGIMHNFEETKQRIQLYSEQPFSIIFVGVGRADFSTMYALCDASSKGRLNTSFVEFRNYQDDPTSLATAALKNIPRQVSEYLVQNEISLGLS